MEFLVERPAVGFAADPVEAWLAERGLAVARLLLAVSVLAVVYFGPSDTPPPRDTASVILAGYVAFAAAVLLLLTRTRTVRRRVIWAVHAADILGGSALMVSAPHSASIFFIFLLYPLFAAGYRWGFPEVVGTTLGIVGLLASAAAAYSPAGLQEMVLPILFVSITGAVTGYLAEQSRRARFEDRTVSLALARARLGGKFGDTVNVVLASVREAFRATEVMIVLSEQSSGRMLIWANSRKRRGDETPRPEQVPMAHHADYRFDVQGAAWHAAARWPGGGRRFAVVAIDESGRRLPSASLDVPAPFLAAHRCRRLIGVPLQLDDEWFAQILVVGPGVGVQREQTARFAFKLATQIAPPLYDHYLARQLRTRAQALERSRIARELHDGVTQSLLGLEMEVVVLQRRAIAEAPQLVSDLTRVHGIVRDEVVTVRELMEGIRVGDVRSADMLHHLTEVVDRFSRYTGIAARFVSDGRPAALSAHSRRQVARIVHEALVNVRKHSGADRVLVRADVDDGWWRLSIEDDGKGFSFAGRKTLDELVAQHQGPRTIVERVRIIGGDLAVESRPGFGARLEVAVPVTQVS